MRYEHFGQILIVLWLHMSFWCIFQ